MKQIVVFTDGACQKNGRQDAKGGFGVHFPNKELKDISKPYTLGSCTNQKTELYAIYYAIEYIDHKIGLKDKELLIKTDSMYSINCVTVWIKNWIKNGWKTKSGTPVLNKDLISKIYKKTLEYPITLEHVEAHTGNDDPDSIGNEKADALAKAAVVTDKATPKPKPKASAKPSYDDIEVILVGRK